MKYHPSAFYANFSLNDLIRRNTSAFKLDDAGGGIGGGGGVIGGSSGDSAAFHYQKSESLSFQIRTDCEADQGEFISLLRTDLQNEIATRGAQINSGRELEVGGFQIEYSEDGIQGCIEISGKLSGATNYTVKARLTEASTSEKRPLIETPKQRHMPDGTYYVVAFMPDDPRALSQEFHEIGQRILRESTERVMKSLSADYSRKDSVLQNLQYAEVY